MKCPRGLQPVHKRRGHRRGISGHVDGPVDGFAGDIHHDQPGSRDTDSLNPAVQYPLQWLVNPVLGKADTGRARINDQNGRLDCIQKSYLPVLNLRVVSSSRLTGLAYGCVS